MFLLFSMASGLIGVTSIRILIKTSVHLEPPMNAGNPRGFRSWPEIDFKPLRVESRHPMPDKTYLIRFKCSHLGPHLVTAASAEIHGEHLVFLRSDGSLAALFVLDIVESWPEVEA
jgi:hypothetical protein